MIFKISSAYLALHRRVSYRYVTPYRVLIRTLGRSLLRRVLDRPPLALPEAKPDDACIHLLTKSNECLFALWACRSLLDQLDEPIPLFVHDDGGLTQRDVHLFETALPGVRVVRRDEADALARQGLDGLPNCLRFRESNVLSLKLFDPWIVQETGDIILLDSDVLFFRRPLELIHWLDHPEERRTRWNMYWTNDSVMEGNSRETRHDEYPSPVDGFNSGLGFLKRDLMSFETIEDLLSRRFEGKIEWLMEQNLYGRLSARAGMVALPPTYHVAIESVTPPHGLVAKHYVGMVRGFFIAEGIWWLLNRADSRDNRGEHTKAYSGQDRNVDQSGPTL
jgi:hypothetical protein